MATQPNIVLITCHDLGRHLHCYGVEPVTSPHIDQLAAEGVRFDRTFCTAPQCSPSRASLFTGRYPHNNGVMGLCHADFAWDLNANERHIASLLAEHGYETVLLGLFHEARDPAKHGFQQQLRPPSNTSLGQAEEAGRFLRERDGTRPFYLQIGFFEPHRSVFNFPGMPDTSRGVAIPPWLVNDIGAQEEFAYYQGSIRRMDEGVGRVRAALEEQGLLDETIFVFTTDHGMPFPRAKCSVYDPGLEIAQVMRYPAGGWGRGQATSAMTSNLDVMPTLLDAAGIDVPANVQGRSLLGVLRGETDEHRDEVFGQMTYHDYCDPRRCIRTKSYKLIANFTNAPFFMDPSQSWRPKTLTKSPPNPPYAYHPPIELYDLERDPLEFRNLADDPQHAARRKELVGRLHAWMRETNDPILEGIPMSPMHRRTLMTLERGDDPGA